MRFTSRNLLILILVVQLVLLCQAGGPFDWFKKKDDNEEAAMGAAKKGGSRAGMKEPAARRGRPAEQDEPDEEEDGEQEAEPPSEADTVLERMARIKEMGQRRRPQQQVEQPANRYKKPSELDKIREAAAVQGRIEAKQEEKRHRRRGYTENDNKVQGRGRRGRKETEEEARRLAESELDEDEIDDQDEADDDDEKANTPDAATKLVERLKDKTLRDQAATKFVSTKPEGEVRTGFKKPNLDFLETSAKSGLISEKSKVTESSFWQKKLTSAYKATKKGLKEGAKVISEMPKYMEKSIDSINALLQLDSKGKILALMDQVSEDAQFVRKQFSQFTLSWSPIMEKALNYLGDTDLDKIKWKDDAPLDFKKDALYSLVFGYEFMSLMIIWRENLLVAHEAYHAWLEGVKEKVESKKVELSESVIFKLQTAHSYMMLVTWNTIDMASQEIRDKLDYAMNVMNDVPKNYESEYFRNIVVLQELYVPTIEELKQERSQVEDSISESGVVAEDLKSVDEFFDDFRSSLVNHQLTNIDWEVPEQLEEFMAKLEPQLSMNTLVYTKAFLKDLKQKRVERAQQLLGHRRNIA